MATEKKKYSITLPEGRLINHAFFERDVYVDQATGKKGEPNYKGEVAIKPDLVWENSDLENLMAEAVRDKWGPGAEEDFMSSGKGFIDPRLDGNDLADARAKKDKPGDAYKGMTVIRANTKYNGQGVDGPGGIQVYDEAVTDIDFSRKGEIYEGCMGCMAVSIHTYEADNPADKRNKLKGLKFYLDAFQKTGEGERLITGVDKSKLFKPVGRQTAEQGGRRRRAG